MKWSKFASEMPLLVKELNEQSARKRTYIVRFAYAASLFVGACVLFYGNLGGGSTASSMGQGRFMFERLVYLQFWGIYIFLPAMASGVLTVEKERDSLSLLMLTTLQPWAIVVQKLLGRLIPMLTFLLLSFPLMAIAYSFGGVTTGHLWSAIILLVLTCVQIGALAVMCSAYFRTTPEAFIATYLLTLCGAWWGPALFEQAGENAIDTLIGGGILSIASIGVMLWLARTFLVARAFVPARNLMLQFFQYLDSVFNEANKVTGGMILVKDGDPLPDTEPVAWRETAKKSLGTFRYLFRVLTVLELPILFTCQLMRGPGGPGMGAVTVLLYLLWGIAAAMIAVHAASVVSSERSHQTLDVLLTTPISGRQLILQKLRGVRRLIFVLTVPFLTIFWFELWFRGFAGWDNLLYALLTIFLYLPLVAWFALWLSFRLRTQMRAILSTLMLIVLWVSVPSAVHYVLTVALRIDLPDWSRYFLVLSPATAIRTVETPALAASLLPESIVGFYTVNFVFYGSLLMLVRSRCLRGADRYLGRVPEPTTTPAEGDEESGVEFDLQAAESAAVP